MKSCFCGCGTAYDSCCELIINGAIKPVSAEALMRSRYTAYAIGDADYLVKTTHHSTQKDHKKSDILAWSKSNNWNRLEILNATTNTVTFNAFYTDQKGVAYVHFEKSTFVFENENWYYVEGEY